MSTSTHTHTYHFQPLSKGSKRMHIELFSASKEMGTKVQEGLRIFGIMTNIFFLLPDNS